MSTQLSEAEHTAPPDRFTTAGRHRRRSAVPTVALAMVAVSVLLRAVLVAGQDYFNDDLRLLHLADTHGLVSLSYLAYDYDGQFMPGALLLVGLAERVAPLQWWPAALVLVVLQLVASLALLQVLRVLLGNRPLLLVPLAFGLFSPITLGSATWWAAGLNSLPLQIGLALFLAEAVLLARTGRRRHAVRGTLVLALALGFYLKAVLVPALGLAVVALVLLRDGEGAPLAAAWRRCRELWAGSAAVLVLWAAVYVVTRSSTPGRAVDVGEVLITVASGLRALTPAVLGGPFSWAQLPPSAPLSVPPPWLAVVGVAVLLAACAATCLYRRGAAALWALVAVEVLVGLTMAGVGRSVLGLSAVLPIAYRYFALEAVLLPVAGALLAVLPSRGAPAPESVRAGASGLAAALGRAVARARAAEHLRRGWLASAAGHPGERAIRVTAAATVAFVVLALGSTADYARDLWSSPSVEFMAGARDSLAAADPTPLLDQELPPEVMWKLTYPSNLVSQAFSPLRDRPPVSAWTTDLRQFDGVGVLRPADVVPGASAWLGPVAGCGWSVGPGGDAELVTDVPLVDWTWTARLEYVADQDGEVTVAFGSGAPVRVGVRQGQGKVYVRLSGGGQALRVSAPTPGLDLCVSGTVIGGTVFS